MKRYAKKQISKYATISREHTPQRVFQSVEDACIHDLACAVIEQAVYDWMQLDYGRLGYCHAKNANGYLYRAEVKSFFQGKWFEYLLQIALPQYTPEQIRKQLKVEEPMWGLR